MRDSTGRLTFNRGNSSSASLYSSFNKARRSTVVYAKNLKKYPNHRDRNLTFLKLGDTQNWSLEVGWSARTVSNLLMDISPLRVLLRSVSVWQPVRWFYCGFWPVALVIRAFAHELPRDEQPLLASSVIWSNKSCSSCKRNYTNAITVEGQFRAIEWAWKSTSKKIQNGIMIDLFCINEK